MAGGTLDQRLHAGMAAAPEPEKATSPSETAAEDMMEENKLEEAPKPEEKLQDVFQMAHHVKQNCGKTTVVKAKRCLAFGLQEVSKSVI